MEWGEGRQHWQAFFMLGICRRCLKDIFMHILVNHGELRHFVERVMRRSDIGKYNLRFICVLLGRRVSENSNRQFSRCSRVLVLRRAMCRDILPLSVFMGTLKQMLKK